MKQVNELLDSINPDGDVLSQVKDAIRQNAGVAYVLKVNGIPEFKYSDDLGEGYLEGTILDKTCPAGMGQIAIQNSFKNWNIFLAHSDSYNGLNPEIRRKKFIQAIEALQFDEAEVLVFAKDNALNELYPWITKELTHQVFA